MSSSLAAPPRGNALLPADTLDGTGEVAVTPAFTLLTRLLDTLVVLPEEWDELAPRDRDLITQAPGTDALLDRLVTRHLLTGYQAEAVRDGRADDLILGHYRVLDVLGQGGMGTVFRAEHLQLRRQVALKVMARAIEGNPRLLHRFYAEARAVARLQHPNIIGCTDAGLAVRSDPAGGARDYFVMEFYPGQDLYHLVRETGPLTPHRACDLFRQIADALAEAHKHGLVHRDIKPSNVLVTPDWQAKVLDFGLARLPDRDVTEAGTLLGTVGYMAPEQARDPHAVDARADLWSLGATMYWALSGREPYPESGNPVRDLHRRFSTSPDPVRAVRPEVPAEVSDLVARLMDNDPDQRFPSARTVAAALTGFTHWLPAGAPATMPPAKADRVRVLLVDDEPPLRRWMTAVLKGQYEVREACDAETALADVVRNPPDVIVADVNLPGLSGPELIARIRATCPDPDAIKILLVSGALPTEALGGLAVDGADDFLAKPFSSPDFLSRIRSLVLRRGGRTGPGTAAAASKATAVMSRGSLERTPRPVAPPARPTAAAEALSYTASRLLTETNLAADGHWSRVGRYVRALAGAAAGGGEYARLKDPTYVDLLAAVAPVYDVGLLAVPRNVLMKPDKLDEDERSVVQSHTTAGSEVLMAVAGKFAADVPSLPLAAEVARGHHERWDGTGYPDGLAGAKIPLAARLVAVAAVYEALRSRRPHRPPLNHARAVNLITTESAGHFDPTLLAAFATAAPRFEQIHQGG
ncbi:protein kinase domain-containing protein [Urbifossiella limnaea]|uniref:Serine/threonine-protein kinase PknB n=1 Tax=Urbifossiella limnaea TaxID=2528023 RepID=A0A517XZS1_9BACT|nr:protein kinase [Urbifossiella limnaea]QDU22958.1 Serine/threonine-protein kinase PknB [Urbifossiella limnaea]